MSHRLSRPEGALPRPDIQVLRAFAVLGVLIYHLWPTRLPGGFVGVDVFFVVSGFLITSHLLTSAQRPTGFHIGRFWAKRARRLLPLAGVVLLATVVAAFLFMPASSWTSTLRNAIASALYGQNWLLAADSVNYLTRDDTPPPTQHFWSLSVEEQFYIVWPLLLLVAIAFARRPGRAAPSDAAVVATRVRRYALAIIAAVFVASLAYSVLLTPKDPGLAYFATTTRAWEFAAGGLVAFFVPSTREPSPRSRRGVLVRVSAAWIGYAGIVATMVLLPTDAPFPGWIALIPVLATVACLAAGDSGRVFAPTALARLRPVTYLGDISYGVYLWHWPLIVILTTVIGPLSAAVKIAVIAAAIALAALSKITVEDPFRFGRMWATPWWRGFIPAAVSIVAVVAVAGAGMVALRAPAPQPAAASENWSAGMAVDPGAALVPSVATRLEDKSGMYDCFDLTHTEGHSCSYGDADAPTRVAVAGDSHAAMYLPALRGIAEERGWRLDTFVGVSCDDAFREGCADGEMFAQRLLDGEYDLVLVSSYRSSQTPSEDVHAYWRTLVEGGVPLVPIVDVPSVTETAYRCIDDSGGDAAAASLCTVPREEALQLPPDRVGPIATELGLAPIDPTAVLCGADDCPQVIGNTIVYQDLNAHLTTTAVFAIRPWLEKQLDDRLAVAAAP
ncbi:acyltransferase family protein [Microbacterium sp. NPDC089189]|uniref:acyltransferase family protein n=1 Tax=Microbacterium sp. NPDC089189 TaxID=3154972 RepID=UPI00342968A3